MYYLVFGLLYLLSLLPFTVLYLVSDICYGITYYLIGYRKAIVDKNLQLAFPEKTADERKQLARAFYHHFWDNWFEALKLLSISKASILQRVSGDMAALEQVYKSGRSCYVLMGHQFNWEWSSAFVMIRDPFPLLAAYSPLSSKLLDRLFLYLRKRFGAVLIPFNDMRRCMLPWRNTAVALALMADQRPPIPEKAYWVNFFNTATPFLPGPEKGARRGHLPVIFVGLQKPERGHYVLKATLLTDDAAITTEGELTRLYAQALETSIRKQPALYLWTHNRWRHRWSDGYDKRLLKTSAPPGAQG